MAELLGLVFSIAFVAGVLGNLIASVIWAGPAFWHLHRKLDRHHRELTGKDLPARITREES